MLRRSILMVTVSGAMILASCGNSNKQADGTTAAKPSEAAPVATETVVKDKNILFFGTSLTAGYGLDQSEAYPALLQERIDSLNLPYKTINGGLSGETSAAGKSRIDWLLKQPIAIFVLELGANDGLRGIAVKETTANLQAIIDKVKKKYPQAKMVLTGMEVPPNMGDKYASDFRNMFKELAAKNEMVFVPFLLDGVAGIPKLNQGDGIHPTAEGQHILAENVWIKLKDLL
ncbi:MAG: arylesterase [Chitinophagaceae bacterium]|nr:MAG: arylesterase [Chitinophagaceae bacterium]